MLPLLYKKYRNTPAQTCSNGKHNGGFLLLLFAVHIQYLRQSLSFHSFFLDCGHISELKFTVSDFTLEE
jgi:hypothetical protein